MSLRWSRRGLKFIPTWQEEQDKIAEKLTRELRSNTGGLNSSYCLFLRPFRSVPHEYNVYRDEYIPVEERIAEVFHVLCPIITVGRKLTVGPGSVESSDEQWQADVRLLMKHATVIIVLPDRTPGMAFEIKEILKSKYLDKTIFIAPPAFRDTETWEEEWDQASQALREAGLQVPDYSPRGIILQYEFPKTAPILFDMGGDVRGLTCMHDFVRRRLAVSGDEHI